MAGKAQPETPLKHARLRNAYRKLRRDGSKAKDAHDVLAKAFGMSPGGVKNLVSVICDFETPEPEPAGGEPVIVPDADLVSSNLRETLGLLRRDVTTWKSKFGLLKEENQELTKKLEESKIYKDLFGKLD